MSLQTLDVADVPAWLLKLMWSGGNNRSAANRQEMIDLVKGKVPEGQRNQSIARICGHLFAKRVDPRICLDLMLAFNAFHCTPPLDEAEVGRVVASIDHLAFTKLINRK